MGQLTNKLKRGSIESFLLRIAGMVSLFAMHALLGQKLSPEYYGLFSFSLSIATTLVLFSTMGWPAAMSRLVPQYIVERQWGLLKGVLLRSHQLSLLFSIVLSSALIGLSLAMAESEKADAYYFAALLLPILSLIALRRRIFQGLHAVKGAIVPDEILLPFFVFIGLLLAGQISIQDAIWLYVLAACVIFAFTLIWLRRVLPSELIDEVPSFDTKIWLKLRYPLLIGGLTQMALTQSGVFLLGIFGELADVGLYSAAFRFALLVTFAMTAVNVIGMPMLASAFHNKDTCALKMVYRKTLFWSFWGALPVVVIFAAFPDYLLSLFGAEFRKASTILQILILGQLVNAATGLAGSLLVVTRQERFFASSMTLCTLICVLLMIIFIPLAGALAAAIIYSASLALLSTMQFYAAYNSLSNIDAYPASIDR